MARLVYVVICERGSLWYPISAHREEAHAMEYVANWPDTTAYTVELPDMPEDSTAHAAIPESADDPFDTPAGGRGDDYR